MSEPFHFGSEGQTPGLDPGRADYSSFISFSDPDGNNWLIQEVKQRAPGRWGIHRQLQVDYHVTLRLGATDQQIALGGRLERFGLVLYIARDQAAFAGVADSRTARPAHRHVAGFREIEKARKLCVPAHIEATAHKRHSWTRTHRARRWVRSCMRPIHDARRYRFAWAENLRMHPVV